MSKKSFTDSLSDSFKARETETAAEKVEDSGTTNNNLNNADNSSKGHKPKKTMKPIAKETKRARVTWQFTESLVNKIKKAAKNNNVPVQEFVARILEDNVDDYL